MIPVLLAGISGDLSDNLAPLTSYLLTVGGSILTFFAGVAAIYFAVMIALTGFKAARAEDSSEKKALIQSVIWKIIWFIVVATSTVIFGVLSAMVAPQ